MKQETQGPRAYPGVAGVVGAVKSALGPEVDSLPTARRSTLATPTGCGVQNDHPRGGSRQRDPRPSSRISHSISPAIPSITRGSVSDVCRTNSSMTSTRKVSALLDPEG